MPERPGTATELQKKFEEEFAKARAQANDLKSLEGMKKKGGKQAEEAKKALYRKTHLEK